MHTRGNLTIRGPSPGGSIIDDGGDYALVHDEHVIAETFNRIGKSSYSPAKDNARIFKAARDSYDKHCGTHAVVCAEDDLFGQVLDALKDCSEYLHDCTDDYGIRLATSCRKLLSRTIGDSDANTDS